MNHLHLRSSRQRGFTLIEALISLVVMAFGMLALSGMQLSLSRNADLAKQRTEAMRLAQARIEDMRSFTGISTGTINWNGLDAIANATTVTNTTYTVASTMSGVDTDSMRPVNVQVTWADRTGANQAVNIASVISQTDPRDPGFIGNPLPLNAPLKRPKNRNINIPIPALDLGNGKSSTQFSVDYVIVYSNIDAGIVNICDPVTAGATATEIEINAALAGTSGSCSPVTGYIVAGYIGRTSGTVTFPTGIKHDVVGSDGIARNTAFAGQAIKCLFSDATDQGNGTVITANNGYKYYLCVVPLSAPFSWGGTVRLGGVPTGSNLMVCRYQYTQTAVTANERNIQPYVDVNASMDEQNYQIVTSGSNAAISHAGSTTQCPAAMTVTGVSVGVVHQDCRTQNPNKASECTAPTP